MKKKWKKTPNAEKKLKEVPFGIFQHSVCCENPKQLKEGPFGDKFFFKKNVPQCRKKNQRWDPSVSFGIVCYAEKKEKPL